MSAINREIRSQAESWRSAAALAVTATASGDLPPEGARLAAIGCGTSLYVSQAIATIRESAGHGETDAFTPAEFPESRRYDSVLAISRSGTTTEVLRFLDTLAAGPDTFAITAVGDAPIAQKASHSVVIDFADEQSVVQTRSATSALALFRAYLGEDLTSAIADAEEAVNRPLPFAPAAFNQFVFLGTGWTIGLANEAALKMREAAGAWAEAYPAMEYRHGPIGAATPRTVVWSLGPLDEDLAAQIENAGATVVRGSLDPMAELILAQRCAVALADAREMDPDHPRHLTRSVVLP